MQVEALSFSDVASIIKNVGPYRTVLVEGENGIGKTSLFHYLKALPEFTRHIAVDPIDCTQLSDGSVWMPDIDRERGVSRELPNERFGVHVANQRGVNDTKPVLVCLDEVLKAPQYIKNVLAPIIYERRVGNYHMPDESVVFGCTNLSLEGLGDSLQAHLRNRLVVVRMRKPTREEWDRWAEERGIEPSVRAFCKMYERVFESFLDYEPGGSQYKAGVQLVTENPYIFNPRAQQDGYASPRSLHCASDIIKYSGDMSYPALEAALVGAIGLATAKDMAAFVKFDREVPSFDVVVKKPKEAPIVDNPTAQMVQIFQFVSRVKTRDEAAAITVYARRMKNEMQSMLCNVVANSSRVATFCTVQDFTLLLKENHVYL